MTARELHCTAGHVVGVRLGPAHAGLIALRHAGQEIIAAQVICVRCVCGAIWKPDAPRLPFEDFEVKAPTLAGGR